MFGINHKAAPEYVNSKTAVLWDMNTCPVPDGYDGRRVRPSIESALKELGYCGEVTITAIGELENTSPHVLQGLSSTGIVVQHSSFNMVPKFMFDDVVKFKSENPAPATIVLISDDVKDRLNFCLCRNQQSQPGYNLVVVCKSGRSTNLYLYYTAELYWETLLAPQKKRRYVVQNCSESADSALILCRSCNCPFTNFTNHLSTQEHKNKEIDIIKIPMLFTGIQDMEFYKVEKNQAAAPQYVNAKTAVWWDMDTCPVPDGYDARRVRPSIESALKELGYCGEVTITAIGNLDKTSPHVLHGLSSTGIVFEHTISDMVSTYLFHGWFYFKSDNPPPATIMLISDQIQRNLPRDQQTREGYNIVVARSRTPTRVSYLYHTAEWLWQTLLAADSVSVANKHETIRYDSDSASILCQSCGFNCLSVTDFTCHLSSEKHKQKEIAIIKSRMSDSEKDMSDSEEDKQSKAKSDSEEDMSDSDEDMS